MTGEQCRYFIELQPADGAPVPRNREAELRREQAARFIAGVYEWLRQEDMQDKVASMAVTALGQIQIICEADFMQRLRQQDEDNIASVRHSAMFVETMGRWNDARPVITTL